MPIINAGDVVGIRCTVQAGPFSEERLISFEAVDGPVSGFVNENELKRVDDIWLVRAVVQSVHDDILEVIVRGSFFTTNGLASIQKSYAMAA
jgi:hypothetical protein